MADPLSIHGIHPAHPVNPADKTAPAGRAMSPDGKSFENCLLESLEQVNRLQQEATQGVEKVVTGETENIAEVFSAVRKADVAFSMLMEMRNKLVDAYREIQQMRM
ncbi:MAG TPA: flagellar hook-basal body complex protein FliE [Phycisphaerae bacterium]|jgi:flagellar hook-basal body complex protein FliE|nr:flagellar hook-basal body complex protein FliE [Phycisphaerae bacterium]HOB74204.1 flagellar hook-basal body complex protein FliE [Phycisphaerae bacterium]HOJ54992.1 flagellar hook-basal body complex protein FliE [Phycisphaerae bacterium]HOL26987.1 flagellar hook-basal body complex protein FliE [Phycisphaerae bacterium]HPP21416.1 flagellar hook-basal body complex protein FliE [Phycisphaerae bacterium]